MNNISWRKRFSILLNRLYLYPAPEPMPRTQQFWLAMGVVTLAAALFSGFFIAYLTGLQNAYLTHAEDLGIMDQAMWNLVHGHMLQQTICNILTDTNCYSPNGISRFAIHFEPILFPLSILYVIAPNPKTLVIFQTLVVASGAFPAFWLARLRLRNEWASMAIAVIYLLFPAQQEATFFDFHAVTLTAALLLFVLYFMYTRRTAWMFVFAILAMACKEEIPLVLAIYGLWSCVFQRRWRSGLALTLLGLTFAVVALLIIPRIFSPTGHQLLASRYSYLGATPVQIALNLLRHPGRDLKSFILEPNHLNYLRTLLAPTGFLALLAPWILVLAIPTLGINLLSSDTQMYSGLFQYSAEIVPALIFATIEALVLLLWLTQILMTRLRLAQVKVAAAPEATTAGSAIVGRRTGTGSLRTPLYIVHGVLLTFLTGFLLINVVRIDALRGHMPFTQGFQWPQVTTHDLLAQEFAAMIPSDASVSAQSSLVPHISERTNVYMFPYATGLYKTTYQAQYIFLDVTSDIYPYYSSYYYVHDVKLLMINGDYGVVAAQDGYLLLKKGLPPPGLSPYSLTRAGGLDPELVLPNLPASFCTFAQVSAQDVRNPLEADFTSPDDPNDSMSLVGYRFNAPNPFSRSAGYTTVVTYWQVRTPISAPLQPAVLLLGSNGDLDVMSTDFPGALWCPTNSWQPGPIMSLTSRVFGLQASDIPTGLAHMGIALVPLLQSSDTMTYVKQSLPAHVVRGTAQAVNMQQISMVEVMPLTIIP
jgi:uncharacterized membrane protein